MLRHTVSPEAKIDIDGIRKWTTSRFGAMAATRYDLLIEQAIWDICENPERAGSYLSREPNSNLRVFHLRSSRNRVQPARNRVKEPRHYVVFRVLASGELEISRLLHDRMVLPFGTELPENEHD